MIIMAMNIFIRIDFFFFFEEVCALLRMMIVVFIFFNVICFFDIFGLIFSIIPIIIVILVIVLGWFFIFILIHLDFLRDIRQYVHNLFGDSQFLTAASGNYFAFFSDEAFHSDK